MSIGPGGISKYWGIEFGYFPTRRSPLMLTNDAVGEHYLIYTIVVNPVLNLTGARSHQ